MIKDGLDFNLNNLYELKLLKESGYNFNFDSDWLTMINKNDSVINQGWKIHLSCSASQFGEMIKIVMPILVKKNLSFKVPINKHAMISLTTGGSGLMATGKMMTIYPSNQDDVYLENLASELSSAIKFFKFPIIFTDAQYKDSNVFFRYGSFVSATGKDNRGFNYPVLYNEKKIEMDVREFGRYKPDFVKKMNFLSVKNSSEELQSFFKKQGLSNIELIKRTSKGNLYKGLFNDKKVYIKEGYDYTLVDENDFSAKDRLLNELFYLKKISLFANVPRVLHYFEYGQSLFLVEEEIEGYSLEDFFYIGKNHQKNYSKDLVSLILNMLKEIKKIHQRGFVLRDISPSNIIVSKNNEIYFIDLEVTTFINDKTPFNGATPGFFPVNISRTALRVNKYYDLYSIGAVIFYLCTSIKPIFKEALNKENPSIFLKKLKKIINVVCISQDINLIAHFGIYLMENKELTYEEIEYIFKNKIKKIKLKESYESVERVERVDVLSESKKYILNEFKKINTNQYGMKYSLDSFKSTQKISLDKGVLGLLFVIMAHVNKKPDPVLLDIFEEILIKISNSEDTENHIVNNLMNGSVSLLYLIPWFLKKTKSKKQNFEILHMYKKLLKKSLDECDFQESYKGIMYGTSGVGLILLLSLNLDDDIEIKNIKIEIVDKIFLDLEKRFEEEVKTGVLNTFSEENLISTELNDLGYGIAGVGLFLIHYFKLKNKKEILKYIQIIYVKLIDKKRLHEDGSIYWNQYTESNIDFPFLFSGLSGIGLFFSEHYLSFNDDVSKNILQDIKNKLEKENFILSSNILQGASSILLALSFIESDNCDMSCLKKRYRNILLAQSSRFEKGIINWAIPGQYTITFNSFLVGATGIYTSLLYSL